MFAMPQHFMKYYSMSFLRRFNWKQHTITMFIYSIQADNCSVITWNSRITW